MSQPGFGGKQMSACAEGLYSQKEGLVWAKGPPLNGLFWQGFWHLEQNRSQVQTSGSQGRRASRMSWWGGAGPYGPRDCCNHPPLQPQGLELQGRRRQGAQAAAQEGDSLWPKVWIPQLLGWNAESIFSSNKARVPSSILELPWKNNANQYL